jgi:hypothetical protein
MFYVAESLPAVQPIFDALRLKGYKRYKVTNDSPFNHVTLVTF